MQNKLESLKTKKFGLKHVVGSFFSGVLVTVLVVYGTGLTGSQSQGYLTLNRVTPINQAALNPAALETVNKVPTSPGTCSVTNCDINAKLDLILNQITIKNGGSQTLAQYVVEQFTDTRNSFQFLGGQFTNSNNMLTNILNTTQTINNYFLPGTFTDIMNKLNIINSDTSTTRQYFMPNIFTDILGKLDALLAK